MRWPDTHTVPTLQEARCIPHSPPTGLDIVPFTAIATPTVNQGLALVHFSAEFQRILWDRGAFRGCLGGVKVVSGGIKEYHGVLRVYILSGTAQVELRSGRV